MQVLVPGDVKEQMRAHVLIFTNAFQVSKTSKTISSDSWDKEMIGSSSSSSTAAAAPTTATTS
jgi:hypothetical protein